MAMPAVLISWTALVLGGMWTLSQYEHSSAPVHLSPARWPAESQLSVTKFQPTLLLFAHPKCPCTRATIGELARIMTECKEDVRAYAIFVKPPPCSNERDWEKTDLWNSAAQIPGVTAIVDIDGIEASRFQAATSGVVILYDKRGQLQFRGGITASRGHSGDNLGRSTIVNLLIQGSADVDNTRVYGCELGINFNGPDQKCCQQ
jgi:hypothetical protein